MFETKYPNLYYVVDNDANHNIGIFGEDQLKELWDAIYTYVGYKYKGIPNYYKYATSFMSNNPNLVDKKYHYPCFVKDIVGRGISIFNFVGDVIPWETLRVRKEYSYSSQHREHTYRIQCELGEKLSGSNKILKIKSSYKKKFRHYSGYICDGVDVEPKGYYRFVESNYYRRIKTLQSIKFSDSAYLDEYEPKVRAKRSALPSTFDDIGSKRHKMQFSWKSNSKRKKQWIPKGLTG